MKISATTAVPALVLLSSLAYVADDAVQHANTMHMPP